MIKVGLTGGIGSGKSYIAGYLKTLGVPVYNSDVRGRVLSNTHPLIIKAFIERFGAGIYTEGQLNRKKVANIVFNDQDALHWINQLVHPIVQEDYNRWVEEQHARIIVKEAAILIESGAYKDCDKIVVVTAPIKVRIERVVKRDHLTEGEVLQRILHQMDDEERKGYANFVIVNDGILPIEPQVDKILYQLQKTYEGR